MKTKNPIQQRRNDSMSSSMGSAFDSPAGKSMAPPPFQLLADPNGTVQREVGDEKDKTDIPDMAPLPSDMEEEDPI